MYPVKRTYPTKVSTSPSNNNNNNSSNNNTPYPVRYTGNVTQQQQQQRPGPSGTPKRNITSPYTSHKTHTSPATDNSTTNKLTPPNVSTKRNLPGSEKTTYKSDTCPDNKRQKFDPSSSASQNIPSKSPVQPQWKHKKSSEYQIHAWPKSEVKDVVHRKESEGDPSNPLYIPDLTIYLPPPETPDIKMCDLLTLFESCARSKMQLKMAVGQIPSGKHFETTVYIKDDHICTAYGTCPKNSRVSAAREALDILCDFQPCVHNNITEIKFTFPDKIHGLKLFKPNNGEKLASKEECLDVIMDSCLKCDLPVTWWDDGGGTVLGEGRSTVLLINGKPITSGVGKDLEDSMKEAALRAVKALDYHHGVYQNEGDEEAGLAAGDDEETDLHEASEEKTADINVPSIPGHKNLTKKQKRELKKQLKRQQQLGLVLSSSPQKIPDFTLYLPISAKPGRKNANKPLFRPILVLLESCFKSNASGRMLNIIQDRNTQRWHAQVEIRNKSSSVCLKYTGEGDSKVSAKENAATNAISDLKNCQPCMYQTPSFLRPGQNIEGFRLHVPSKSETDITSLSLITDSCKKSSIELGWWDDGGGRFFGYTWSAVLVMGSKGVCWGHGKDLEEAKEHAAKAAVERFDALGARVALVVVDESLMSPATAAASPAAPVASPAKPVTSPATPVTLKDTNTDIIANTDINKDLTGIQLKPFNGAIPGLKLYVSPATYKTDKPGTSQYESPQVAQSRHARLTLQRSAALCNIKVRLQDVMRDKDVHPMRAYETQLIMGDVLIACGYGETRLAARWNAWEVSFDALMRVQPVVYQSGDEEKTGTNQGNESTSTANQNASMVETDKSYIKQKLQNAAALYAAIPTTKALKTEFNILSEWRCNKASESEMEMAEKGTDVLIAKYLRRFCLRAGKK